MANKIILEVCLSLKGIVVCGGDWACNIWGCGSDSEVEQHTCSNKTSSCINGLNENKCNQQIQWTQSWSKNLGTALLSACTVTAQNNLQTALMDLWTELNQYLLLTNLSVFTFFCTNTDWGITIGKCICGEENLMLKFHLSTIHTLI